MNTCPACGVQTTRRLCYFCQRTVDLIRLRQCVSCTAPVFDQDTVRVEGKCSECVGRHNRLGPATRFLLRQYAKARHALKTAA